MVRIQSLRLNKKIMALDIQFYDGSSLTWHKGDKPLAETLSNRRFLDIVCVAAGMDELGLVLSKFRNLPAPALFHNLPEPVAVGTIVRYYGDHARFIVGNI